MPRVIAIANQKGGVGKTTTAINLSACLAQDGKKVLVIDSDPQGNTSSGFGVEKESLEKTFYDLFIGNCYIEEVEVKTTIPNLKLLPTNVNLAGAEIELSGHEKPEFLLKNIIKNVKYLYDFVLIDCPPALGRLTVNALTAADTVLVPMQCEYFALEGLSQLLYTITLVQKKLNKNLAIEGVVFTMYDSRTNLSMEVVEEVKKHIDGNVYRGIIPRNVRLSEAPSHGMPITQYDPKSKGAQAYIDLAAKVIAWKG